MSKITAYTALSSTTSSDVLPIVDVTDTTQASSGTTKKITVANLMGAVQAWQSGLLMPSGALAETFPRTFATSPNSLTSTQEVWTAIALPAGVTVAHITYAAGSLAQSGGSHGWYALADSTRKYLAVSADQTGAAVWTSNTAVTLAMAAPYTTTAAGVYYLVISITATSMPNILGQTAGSNNTAVGVITPILFGTGDSSSTPPTVGNTAGALTLSTAACLYGYVS